MTGEANKKLACPLTLNWRCGKSRRSAKAQPRRSGGTDRFFAGSRSRIAWRTSFHCSFNLVPVMEA